MTGHAALPGRGGVSEDGRTSVDWLDRYGYLVGRELMAHEWPEATIVVDSQPFQAKSYYPAKHPLAGHPKPNGVAAFAVLAAGIRLPSGSKRQRHDLKVLHVRAFPADHKPHWAAFFRSLPGTPRTIISDPDPQLAYAIREAWPAVARPRHLLSTWHYRNRVADPFTYGSHRGANPYCPDHGTGVACSLPTGIAYRTESWYGLGPLAAVPIHG